MSPEEIETLTGMKTYPMVANQKENRNKMIRVIADVLDMSTENSPLLKELFESTDLSPETLVMLGDTSSVEEKPIIVEDEITLPPEQIENIPHISNTREKIDYAMSKSIEIKPVKFISGIVGNDDIKYPIENALINSDFFEDFNKNNSMTLNEKLSLLFAIINCVFLTRTNPEDYPKFSSFLRNFKMDVFNSKQIKTIRKYYSKIIKQAKA